MSGKQKLEDTKVRWRAIIDIISKYGSVSPTEIVRYLKQEYGIDVSRQTVINDLKKDLDNLTTDDLQSIKTGILNQLDELIQIAYSKAKSDDVKSLSAMNTYNKLIKTKADIVNSFEKMRLEMLEKDRPQYNIIIGIPKEVDLNDNSRATED